MRFFRYWILIFLFFTSGCASIRHAVPLDLLEKAEIVGMPGVRVFGDKPNQHTIQDVIKSIQQESVDDFPRNPDGSKTYSMLSISGGAANGAYGAGLINGWTKSGTRPKFKIVTGISAGALTAPFVFLGPEYDKSLKDFFTTNSTKDIMKVRSILGILFSNSFTNNQPLAGLIADFINEEILEKIAEEHAKGRRLYVGTTNLDAQRFVIWDMGAIATIGTKDALKLFRKIILASAAIPAAFPPVYFNVTVEVGDQKYDEMHVDGGALAQSFFLFGVLQGFKDSAKQAGIDRSKIKVRLYVIRNGFITPVYKEVPDKLSAITERSIDTVINAQGLGDLHRLYLFTEKVGGEFYLAHIPIEFTPGAKEMFDSTEMNRLFDTGFNEAVNGYPWRREPPMPDFQ